MNWIISTIMRCGLLLSICSNRSISATYTLNLLNLHTLTHPYTCTRGPPTHPSGLPRWLIMNIQIPLYAPANPVWGKVRGEEEKRGRDEGIEECDASVVLCDVIG